jgi:hypothetical protein
MGRDEHSEVTGEREGRGFTRRRALGAAGTAGAVLLLGHEALRGPGLAPLGESAAVAASCVLAPEKTEGPFFVDERLNRSDIRANSDGSDRREGARLDLTIVVLADRAGNTRKVRRTLRVPPR